MPFAKSVAVRVVSIDLRPTMSVASSPKLLGFQFRTAVESKKTLIVELWIADSPNPDMDVMLSFGRFPFLTVTPSDPICFPLIVALSDGLLSSDDTWFDSDIQALSKRLRSRMAEGTKIESLTLNKLVDVGRIISSVYQAK